MSLDKGDMNLQESTEIEDLYNVYVGKLSSVTNMFDEENNTKNGRNEQRRVDSLSYRRSLESISEYKTSDSFLSLHHAKNHHSMDSASSDCTDYISKYLPVTDVNPNQFSTQSSSYLSWIDSLNSEYFDATSTDFQMTDSKVGEWNNFWLNYSNARNKYISPQAMHVPVVSSPEEFSDARSSVNNQKEQLESTTDCIYLTKAELTESLECCQKLTDILQNALKRIENGSSKNTSHFVSSQNSVSVLSNIEEEGLFHVADMQKRPSKSGLPFSGNTCIDVIMSTADILKRVINKSRKNSMETDNIT